MRHFLWRLKLRLRGWSKDEIDALEALSRDIGKLPISGPRVGTFPETVAPTAQRIPDGPVDVFKF